MNSAGLPGTGLGGFLYLALALSMPFRELYLTIRGRSSRARWTLVARQFAIACAILAAVEASFWVLAQSGLAPRVGTGVFLLAPLTVSLGMLLVVLTVLWLWALVGARQGSASRRTRRRAPATVSDEVRLSDQ